MKLSLTVRQTIGAILVSIPLTMMLVSFMDYAFSPGVTGYGLLAFIAGMLTLFFLGGMWICVLINLATEISAAIENSDNKFIDFFFKE